MSEAVPSPLPTLLRSRSLTFKEQHSRIRLPAPAAVPGPQRLTVPTAPGDRWGRAAHGPTRQEGTPAQLHGDVPGQLHQLGRTCREVTGQPCPSPSPARPPEGRCRQPPPLPPLRGSPSSSLALANLGTDSYPGPRGQPELGGVHPWRVLRGKAEGAALGGVKLLTRLVGLRGGDRGLV